MNIVAAERSEKYCSSAKRIDQIGKANALQLQIMRRLDLQSFALRLRIIVVEYVKNEEMK